MLTMRDGHADNHLRDKFILLGHVGYFIKGDNQKLMVIYICCTFYIFGD